MGSENIFPNKFLDFDLKDNKFIEQIIKLEIEKIQIFFEKVKGFKMIIFKNL